MEIGTLIATLEELQNKYGNRDVRTEYYDKFGNYYEDKIGQVDYDADLECFYINPYKNDDVDVEDEVDEDVEDEEDV